MNDKPKCFLDTSVWLYIFGNQSNFKRIIARDLISKNQVFCSVQVVNEAVVNLISERCKKKFKLNYDFTESHARQTIQFFYGFGLEFVDLTASVLLKASELREKYSFGHWDSLIVSAALAAGVEILYAEDMHDGLIVEKKLKIINPFAVEKK